MAEDIKKYLGQEALGQLVTEIKAADAATLQSAKDYCDSKDKNFESAGAAAQALVDAKKYTDGAVAPLATTEALNAVDGKVATEESRAKAEEERIVGLVEATTEVADKAAEDIAALAQSHATDKSNLEAKDLELAGAIDDVAEFVGELPEGTDATTVIEYINKKTEGIATDTALGQLQSDVDALEADVTTIKGDYLKSSDKTELAGNIAGVQGAVDALAGTHATDKSALEAAIALKADQTALEGVSAVANAAVTKAAYDEKVAALEAEDARIAGLVATEAARAAGVEAGLEERLAEVETFFELAEGEKLDEAKDTLIEIQKLIDADAAAADQMVKDIAANKKSIEDHMATDHDFAGADAALKSELEGKINTKAESSVVEAIDGRLVTAEGTLTTVAGKVTTLEGEMDAVEAAVATKVEQEAYNTKIAALEEADSTLAGKVAVLEGKFGGAEGSVEDMIADAKAGAEATAAADATQKANAAEANAKTHADGLNSAMDARVAELETASATHALASDVVALGNRVTAEEGKVATLQTEMDAVEAKAADNESAIGTINTELAKKAAQTDLDGAVERIDAVEDAVETKAEQEDLDDAVERISTNETNIAANASAIAKFQPYTAGEVTALFA